MSSPSPSSAPRLRGDDLVLTVLCTATGPLLWWFGSVGLAAGTHGGLQAVEQSVAALCAGTGLALAAWWLVALGGTVLAALGLRVRSVHLVRCGQAVSPAFLRRVAASVLGANLLLAPGAWAGTAGGDAPGTTVGHHSSPGREYAAVGVSAVPRPGWAAAARSDRSARQGPVREVPPPSWRPASPAPPVPGPAPAGRTEGTTPKSVTVRSGDCLWDIAAEELGPYATDLEIDRRWRQWYQQNRTLIGPDAGVLVPGTLLTAPPVS